MQNRKGVIARAKPVAICAPLFRNIFFNADFAVLFFVVRNELRNETGELFAHWSIVMTSAYVSEFDVGFNIDLCRNVFHD